MNKLGKSFVKGIHQQKNSIKNLIHSYTHRKGTNPNSAKTAIDCFSAKIS